MQIFVQFCTADQINYWSTSKLLVVYSERTPSTSEQRTTWSNFHQCKRVLIDRGIPSKGWSLLSDICRGIPILIFEDEQLLASNLKLGHLVPRQQLSTEEIGSFHNKVGTVLEPGTEHLAKQGGKLSTVWWMLVKLELYWILSDLIESLLVILEKILIFGEVPRWEKFSVLGKKFFRKGIGGRPIFMNSFRLFWKSFTKNRSILVLGILRKKHALCKHVYH